MVNRERLVFSFIVNFIMISNNSVFLRFFMNLGVSELDLCVIFIGIFLFIIEIFKRV